MPYPLARLTGRDTIRHAFPFAVHAWSQRVPHVGTVTAFVIHGHVVLVQDFTNGGWNVYTATTDDGEISATIAALAARCNVAPEFVHPVPEEKE